MTLSNYIRIPLALCLLAPLALAGCTDDGGSDTDDETENGDPGDGDGDPGDGDGDPGDGDPGDGDGDPGDGDGDPGDGDGDDDCEPFDAHGVGRCDAFFGYTWTGDDCVGVSGCECLGVDCDKLYESSEACWNDHPLCELTSPCDPDDAVGVGACDLFLGWAWTGDECIGISGCECQGSSCGLLPLELEECEAAHAEC